MKKKVFHPERRMMAKANKECAAFPITALEIDGGMFYVHTGEFADAVNPRRLAVVHRDEQDGSKMPLFYPDKNQVVLETEEADVVYRKMLVQAAQNAGIQMSGTTGEAGLIAFVTKKEPVRNLAAHRFGDLTMVSEGQASR